MNNIKEISIRDIEGYRIGNADETAKALAETKSRFYTCHCTGEKAFRIMKKVLGDRLEYISTGSVTVF